MNTENTNSLHQAAPRTERATVSETILQAALAAGMHVDCGVWTGRTAEVRAFVESVSRIAMRDEFATKAMQGICAHPDTWGERTDGIAVQAYLIADAMLIAREGK